MQYVNINQLKKNKEVALAVMGYVPNGYVLVCEGGKYGTGIIYVDGRPVCCFKFSR